MKHALSLLCVCGALICLLLAPSAAMDSAAYGLALYARLLLPSLYPFFVLSALLVRLGFPRLLGRLAAPAARLLWGISGQGVSALVAGLCGGYPLGAQTAASRPSPVRDPCSLCAFGRDSPSSARIADFSSLIF